jgi:hypothetical protein
MRDKTRVCAMHTQKRKSTPARRMSKKDNAQRITKSFSATFSGVAPASTLRSSASSSAGATVRTSSGVNLRCGQRIIGPRHRQHASKGMGNGVSPVSHATRAHARKK